MADEHPLGTLRKNQELVCRIEALGSQGEGICRELGQVLFVPGALAGETVQVRVQKVTRSLAYGKLLKVLEPSSRRVTPPCPYFGRCGGCALQHLDYPAQLAHKSAQVESCMQRIGQLSLDVPLTRGMENPWQYRNKAALPVQEVSGRPEAGYYAPRSHRLVPVTECLIARPECSAAANAVIQWMLEKKVPAFQEESNRGLVRHIITRVNSRDEVMVTLAINGASIPGAPALIERLQRALPGFHSLHLTRQTAGDNVILGESHESLYGSAPFAEESCGLWFELSPLAFFQVNGPISRQIYQDALKLAALAPDETALDLYSGAGAIALLAAGQCREAIGIEINAQAVDNARANAARNGISNAVFHQGEAERLLPRMRAQGLHADVVFLDPPRKGAHPDVLRAVAAAAPRRILYISCHPASQARDAALISRMGYKASHCQPYDMFCQTAEVENLLCFDRAEKE